MTSRCLIVVGLALTFSPGALAQDAKPQPEKPIIILEEEVEVKKGGPKGTDVKTSGDLPGPNTALPKQKREPGAPVAKVDLGHVLVGQTYRFGGSRGKESWTITAKGPDWVRYTVRDAAGETQERSWRAPAGGLLGLDAASLAELPSEAKGAGGLSFRCVKVTLGEGEQALTTWVPLKEGRPTFPPSLRVRQGDQTLVELVTVEKPRLGAGTTATRITKPATNEKKKSERVSGLEHVKVGTKFVFSMVAAPNMKMIYEVTVVTKTKVTYVTYVRMQGVPPTPGQPMEWPPAGMGQGQPLPEDPNVKVETLKDPVSVGGLKYEALQIQSGGNTVLMPVKPGTREPVFPGLISSTDAQGKVVMELTEIEQP